MNTAQATAAPSVVKLDGREFRMSPLRDCDWGEFEAWIQSSYLQTVKRNLDGLTPEEREHQLDRAFDRAATLTYTSAEGLSKFQTLAGVVKLVWLSIRQNHPEVSEADLLELLSAPDVFAEATDELDAVLDRSGVGRSKKVPRRATKRAARKTTRKRRR